MSNISKRKRECTRTRFKVMGDHDEFLQRISKTLYYGELPSLPCLSLPVTEISCELWSAAARGRSLRRLRAGEAAAVARGACVSPCALVLAVLYLERLQRANPAYLARAAPRDLFLVSLLVSNKFLQDDGEDDETVSAEWAAVAGLPPRDLNRLEMDFLDAIDWKVYVSSAAFEAGLRWLERAVALRQGRRRGFFTYADLAAGGGGGGGLGLAGAALAGLLLGYAVSLAALLASSLLLAHAAAPAAPLAPAPAPAAPAARLPLFDNRTEPPAAPLAEVALRDALEAAHSLRCCTSWRPEAARAGRWARPLRGPPPPPPARCGPRLRLDTFTPLLVAVTDR